MKLLETSKSNAININSFNVTAVTEAQIPMNISATQKIVLKKYSFEHTPTESLVCRRRTSIYS